jgi:hypothetical protein
MSWEFIIIGTLGLIFIACSEKQPANAIVNHDDEVKESPRFFLNSDGTKTYLSSLTICTKDIPSKARPHSCFGGASTVELYAEGDGFVGFDKESLVMNSLLINGIDLSKDRNLKDNFELGTFPKASDDGKYASWSIGIKSGYHSIDDDLELSGHIVAIKSEELIELTSETFNIKDFESFKLGPVLIQGTRASSKRIKDEINELSATEQDLFEKVIRKSAELGDNPTEDEAREALVGLGLDEEKLMKLVGKVLEYAFLEAFSPSEDPDSTDGISLMVKTDFSTL